MTYLCYNNNNKKLRPYNNFIYIVYNFTIIKLLIHLTKLHTWTIYQADVHAENRVMSYYGLTQNEFKKRCSTHKTSFRKIPKCHTTLSSYIWKPKDKKIPHFVNWSIKARGHPFSSGGRACDLCLTEKLIILMADQKLNVEQKR